MGLSLEFFFSRSSDAHPRFTHVVLFYTARKIASFMF